MKSNTHENRKKISKKTAMIINWWVFIGLALMLGFIGLSTSGTMDISKEDYQNIEIKYNRIHVNSGEDPVYTIFSKNDEKSFLINNIVSMYFDEIKFNQQVCTGDSVILTVLKADYESKTTTIKTLGVEKDDSVFLNFDKAYNKDFNNGRWGYYMFMILLPLACALIIAFVIWLMLYNKGIIGQKKSTGERLSRLTQNELTVIRFPVSVSTIIIYVLSFVCGTGLPFFFIWAAPSSAFTALAVLCGVITVFNISSFIMRFLRKFTIDKLNKTLTYFSFFKKTFQIDEVLSLDTKVVTDAEGPNKYYLLIRTQSKTIKVKTQSDEQSRLLKEEIVSLKETL